MSEKEVEPKIVFEKYWDETYKREYFYDVHNKTSLWELP
jgi:hypothetical protein